MQNIIETEDIKRLQTEFWVSKATKHYFITNIGYLQWEDTRKNHFPTGWTGETFAPIDMRDTTHCKKKHKSFNLLRFVKYSANIFYIFPVPDINRTMCLQQEMLTTFSRGGSSIWKMQFLMKTIRCQAKKQIKIKIYTPKIYACIFLIGWKCRRFLWKFLL